MAAKEQGETDSCDQPHEPTITAATGWLNTTPWVVVITENTRPLVTTSQGS